MSAVFLRVRERGFWLGCVVMGLDEVDLLTGVDLGGGGALLGLMMSCSPLSLTWRSDSFVDVWSGVNSNDCGG